MRAITPCGPLHLVQTIRAAHALMESSHPVLIPPEHAEKFQALAPLGARYTIGHGEPVPIAIDHASPCTRIGTLARPLLFPHAIVRVARHWGPRAERTVRVSFAGLVTPARETALRTWIARTQPTVATPRLRQGWVSRLMHRTAERRVGELVLWSSSRGRRFPGKAWDPAYWALLRRSQSVLCPNGDFVWSYRFFEAVLCGALPIVEDTCPAYEGFQYARMTDEPRPWSRDVAEHNADLAATRLTASVEELDAAIG